MKPFSTLTTAALLAATLGTAAAAHTTVITRAPLHGGYTVVTPQATHLPPRHLHPVGVPHLHPRPLPIPGPACLSCPSVPYYDAPFLMAPRVIMR